MFLRGTFLPAVTAGKACGAKYNSGLILRQMLGASGQPINSWTQAFGPSPIYSPLAPDSTCMAAAALFWGLFSPVGELKPVSASDAFWGQFWGSGSASPKEGLAALLACFSQVSRPARAIKMTARDGDAASQFGN